MLHSGRKEEIESCGLTGIEIFRRVRHEMEVWTNEETINHRRKGKTSEHNSTTMNYPSAILVHFEFSILFN